MYGDAQAETSTCCHCRTNGACHLDAQQERPGARRERGWPVKLVRGIKPLELEI
jgi:hypothetical protein